MAGRFDFIPQTPAGLTVIRRKPIEDERGLFERVFCAEELQEIGLEKTIVQINQSLTRARGAVRGMHFQYPPFAETKIVSCLNGEVFDVAVDIRRNSPTFLKWHGEVLSENNGKSLFIPEGFAHGFQTLTPDCRLLYLHTAPYARQCEGALNIEDPLLNIEWPLDFTDVSERDRSHPFANGDYAGIEL